MAEFDRSEHKRPDAVVDSTYENFDAARNLDRRRLAMAIGAPLIVLILAMAAMVTLQARNGQNDEAAADRLQLPVTIEVREAPLRLPQETSNDEMIAMLEQLRAEQELTLNQADLAPVAVRADAGGDPWFLGPGLLWLLVPILAIALVPVLRSRRWDPA